MHLICHVTLHDQLLLGGISSKYATTLVSLVNVGTMMVSVMVSYDRHYIWPHGKTCLNGCLNLWVESLQGVLLPSHVWWTLI